VFLGNLIFVSHLKNKEFLLAVPVAACLASLQDKVGCIFVDVDNKISSLMNLPLEILKIKCIDFLPFPFANLLLLCKLKNNVIYNCYSLQLVKR